MAIHHAKNDGYGQNPAAQNGRSHERAVRDNDDGGVRGLQYRHAVRLYQCGTVDVLVRLPGTSDSDWSEPVLLVLSGSQTLLMTRQLGLAAQTRRLEVELAGICVSGGCLV